jgi:hypothetical protein
VVTGVGVVSHGGADSAESQAQADMAMARPREKKSSHEVGRLKHALCKNSP